MRATSTREETTSLKKMLRRCDSTVFLLRKSSVAISPLVMRSVTSSATWRSRGDNDPSPVSSGDAGPPRPRPSGRRGAPRLGAGAELAQLAPGLVAHPRRTAGVELGLGGTKVLDR